MVNSTWGTAFHGPRAVAELKLNSYRRLTMSVDVLCPQCQQRYKFKPNQIGKNFRCIKCQNQFVPTAPPQQPPTLSPSDETMMGTIPRPPDPEE